MFALHLRERIRDATLYDTSMDINTLTWTVCVRPCVTDMTSLPERAVWEQGYKVYYNASAGNES